MNLRIIGGGLQDIDLNQEMESIEARMAQVRGFAVLSQSQKQVIVRVDACDPIEIVDSIIIDAVDLRRKIETFYP